MKLWKGRFQKEADPKTNDFNSSISIDSRMYKEDIEGSIAHATMLGACGIIEQGESDKICAELEKIAADIESGALHIDPDAEVRDCIILPGARVEAGARLIRTIVNEGVTVPENTIAGSETGPITLIGE